MLNLIVYVFRTKNDYQGSLVELKKIPKTKPKNHMIMWHLFLLKIMWHFEREYIYVYVCISIYMLYTLDALIPNFDDA